jgi:hypothetical protein
MRYGAHSTALMLCSSEYCGLFVVCERRALSVLQAAQRLGIVKARAYCLRTGTPKATASHCNGQVMRVFSISLTVVPSNGVLVALQGNGKAG